MNLSVLISRCESLFVWSSADLIYKLYGQSVRIVDSRVVRLKGDSDVLALSWSNAALYWHHTEHTQPTAVLGSCTGDKRHTATTTMSPTVTSATSTAVKIIQINMIFISLSL